MSSRLLHLINISQQSLVEFGQGAIKGGPGDFGGRLEVAEWQVRTVRTVGQRNAGRSSSNLLLGHGVYQSIINVEKVILENILKILILG